VKDGLVRGDDGVVRCFWAGSDPLYGAYHDEEWGAPMDDDARLYEKVCLEGFQAGLAWITILRKRAAFRRAFREFDPRKVSRFGPDRITRLLADPGIVRHRGKIESAIHNAARALELQREFGTLAAYFWSFEPAAGTRPRRLTHAALRALVTCPESVAMSRDLKRRGWTFVGPTTLYAFMQSVGLVNDHLEGCPRRAAVDRLRRGFQSPAPRVASTINILS
jgi:DNA-3-methyladenine glycosylase I